MPTLTLPLPAGVNVSLGSEVQYQAFVLKAPFGNRYTQRTADGRNSVERTYNVRFMSLTRAEAKVLIDFFADRRGFEAFYYTVAGAAAPTLWVCEEWSKEHVSPTLENVSAKWTEVFAP